MKTRTSFRSYGTNRITRNCSYVICTRQNRVLLQQWILGMGMYLQRRQRMHITVLYGKLLENGHLEHWDRNVNPLKRSGYCEIRMLWHLKLWILLTECMHVICKIRTINMPYKFYTKLSNVFVTATKCAFCEVGTALFRWISGLEGPRRNFWR